MPVLLPENEGNEEKQRKAGKQIKKAENLATKRDKNEFIKKQSRKFKENQKNRGRGSE